MYPLSYNKNDLWPSFCGFSLLLHFISISLSAASVLFCVFYIRQGLLIAPQYGIKDRTLFMYVFGTPNPALYALAPNHVFGQ